MIWYFWLNHSNTYNSMSQNMFRNFIKGNAILPIAFCILLPKHIAKFWRIPSVMYFSLYPLTISWLLWCTKCMKLVLHQPVCLFPSNCIVIIIFLNFYDRLTLLPLSRLPICSWFSLRTHGTSWSLVSLVPYEKGAVWWLPNRLTAPNFCYSVMHCTWIISWGKRGGCWEDNWGSFYLIVITFH